MIYPFFGNSGSHYAYDAELNRIEGVTYAEGPLEFGSNALPDVSKYGIMLFVELTKKCNLSCRYCYQANSNVTSSEELSLDNKFAAIVPTLNRFIEQYKNVHIVFYGGEPVLEFRLMRKLCKYCGKKNADSRYCLSYGVVTNGTLIDNNVEQFFIENHFSVGISLDGNEATMLENRGIRDLSRIENVVIKLSKDGIPAQVISTIQRDRMSNIKQDIDYLTRLPVESIRFVACDSICSSISVAKNSALEFLQAFSDKVECLLASKDYSNLRKLTELTSALKKIDSGEKIERHCGYGKDVYAISQNGRVYPCPSFIGNDDYEVVSNNVKYPCRDNQENCTDCIAYTTCHGSCQFSNYINNLSCHNSLEGRCIINKSITRLALKVYAQLYLE